jgi:hypothetical protein
MALAKTITSMPEICRFYNEPVVCLEGKNIQAGVGGRGTESMVSSRGFGDSVEGRGDVLGGV